MNQFPKVLKGAQCLNDKYRMIQMDLDQVNSVDDVLFQVQTEIDSITFDNNDWLLDELEEEGKTEKQIDRMKSTALKHLNNFLSYTRR
ncbi:hypothetical protein [Salinibacillus xinjiangensis]|uniref:Uncharacterized protein n=1 Tax=Salinibacillus xinjiangensis TaxID=1229268 RepID=A0A6G1X7J1_9BACI|nr:hypothetical protein [Salinibacillus xinjiangensis]MRG86971.1 hypothetical protein [Salinibacillus xinjiangensis]